MKGQGRLTNIRWSEGANIRWSEGAAQTVLAVLFMWLDVP